MYRMPLAGGAPQDLGVPAANIKATVFSPRGDELAYSVDVAAAPELHVLNLATKATRTIPVEPLACLRAVDDRRTTL